MQLLTPGDEVTHHYIQHAEREREREREREDMYNYNVLNNHIMLTNFGKTHLWVTKQFCWLPIQTPHFFQTNFAPQMWFSQSSWLWEIGTFVIQFTRQCSAA